MAEQKTEAPKGTGDNPDVGGITEGPGEADSRFSRDSSGGPIDADAGGRAHTGTDEGHPAGDGPRSAREVGGPKAAEDAPDAMGEHGAKGDIQTKGMEPHE
ncbi:hypothetical protein [Conexibacter sp. SYSU D00693]|uniref:hypothetical protein n=1 Tax=Conexibacter sp. SYSU D00693 TaxID=2812560 RepID=UPI00196A53EA|nr:hypothetical protein [Conexibacter sp. SYSU D00693]